MKFSLFWAFQMLLYIFYRENIFDNPAAGASSDATKVVVIITDGDPSDEDNKIVEKYDAKKIIRFVIGVSSQKIWHLIILSCSVDISLLIIYSTKTITCAVP